METPGGQRDLDDAGTDSWVTRLSAPGSLRTAAESDLHAMLVRVARHEVGRRASAHGFSRQELDDVAHQSAADAMVAILAKLDTFRGDSRFTTWAYRFVVLEVSSALGRRYWRTTPTTVLDAEEWEGLPDRFGVLPEQRAEYAELMAAVREAVEEHLTEHQRRVFVAIVVTGVPLDALVAQLGVSRNTIYKVIFDARCKIRDHLAASGHRTDRSLS